MTFTDDDLERIAASLSGERGLFPVSNLVNYGSTILVRPGARTKEGVVLSGTEIASLLPDAYVAFPLAVEYAAEPAPDLGSDLMGLEADVMGAAPRKELNLRARYARVTERFRYRVARFRAGRKADSLRRAERALRRLARIWAEMKKKGVSRQGLLSPSRLAAELRGGRIAPPARIRPAVPAPMIPTRFPETRPTAPLLRVTPTYAPVVASPSPATPAAPIPAPAVPSTYTPVSKKVSALYLKDQAELEKELAQSAPSYYGATDHGTAQECLAADLRAETVGYLFGPSEHDYYGLDAGGDVEFTSADFIGLVDGSAGERLVSFSADGLDGVSADSMIDLFDGVMASSRLMSRAKRLASSHPGLSSRLRRDALAAMNASSLAKLGAEGSGIEEEVEEDEDEELEDDASVSTPVEQGKAANLQRRALLPSLSELRAVGEGQDGLEKAQRAAQVLTKITDALRSVAPSGSVNYARLVPSSGHGSAEPVIVIGIQKRTGAPDSLLDVLYEEEVERYPAGYLAQDAVRALTEHTSVSDYLGEEGLLSSLVADMNDVETSLYGPVLYGAANAYPNGEGAPLPPPRRVGAEVYGA